MELLLARKLHKHSANRTGFHMRRACVILTAMVIGLTQLAPTAAFADGIERPKPAPHRHRAKPAPRPHEAPPPAPIYTPPPPPLPEQPMLRESFFSPMAGGVGYGAGEGGGLGGGSAVFIGGGTRFSGLAGSAANASASATAIANVNVGVHVGGGFGGGGGHHGGGCGCKH